MNIRIAPCPILKPASIIAAFVLIAVGVAAGWIVRGMVASPCPTAAPVPSPEGAIAATTDSTLSMVGNIMRSGGNELEMPFPKVIEVSTGHRLLPARPTDPVHATALDAIAVALDATLAEMNGNASPVKGLRRINEASAFFEDALRRRLDAHPAFDCAIPQSAAGKAQRSGYPDLRLRHVESGAVIYLDPKLYEDESRTSTLRTFYFTSDPGTLKVGEDAAHWLVGIRHDGADGRWKFTGWDLVDLSLLKVKLKAEFQASNRDLYSKEMILRSSEAAEAAR